MSSARPASATRGRGAHVEREDVANSHQRDQDVLRLIDRNLTSYAEQSIEAGLHRGELNGEPRAALHLGFIDRDELGAEQGPIPGE